jgi:tetratricopeptide (TPR) repeat protein
LAIQSYGNALNVATVLGDTNTAGQIAGTITNGAAAIQDYNTQLNLAFYFKCRGGDQLARGLLERGLALAQQSVNLTSDVHQRCVIHFRAIQRLFAFGQYQRLIDYFSANTGDLMDGDFAPDGHQLQSRCYEAMALASTGHRQQALDQLYELLDQTQANPEMGANVAGIIGQCYSAPATAGVATEFFELAARKYPNQPWANFSRVELAIQRFNAGDYTAAQKLAEEVVNVARENLKVQWVRTTYWAAVYLRGCCMQAQGNADAAAQLKQLALAKCPNLQIQDRLHTE